MKHRILEAPARFAAASAVAVGLMVAGGAAIAADDYPSKRMDWTIAFGAGGGNDIMSRTLINIIDKYDLYPKDIVAENKPGGSGAVGWGYLYNQKGDPYNISSTSGSFITTPLKANTPWGPTSFTPIALLATDDLVLLVNGKSDIKDFKDFIAKAQKDPPSIGGMGAVNVDFIVPSILAEKADFKFDYVSFNEEGALTTALLSNSLDAIMSNPAEIMGLVESGDLKALAYSGKQTPESLKGIPTLAEAGYDVGISMPRGLILAPGVSKEVQQWWIDTIKKVVEKPEWKDYIKKNNLTENIMYGEDFNAFLKKTQDSFAKILREKGAIK